MELGQAREPRTSNPIDSNAVCESKCKVTLRMRRRCLRRWRNKLGVVHRHVLLQLLDLNCEPVARPRNRPLVRNLRPVGIAIVGGLIFSQLLTLYTTPVIYLALDRLARRFGPARRETTAEPAGEVPVPQAPPERQPA